jgi:hypothetical protein
LNRNWLPVQSTRAYPLWFNLWFIILCYVHNCWSFCHFVWLFYCLSFKLTPLIILWFLQTCLITYWFDFSLVDIPRCRCKRHDIAALLLKLTLSTNQSINQSVDIKQNIWSKMIRIFWRYRGVIRICKSVSRRRARIMVMVFSTTFNNISLYCGCELYWWRKPDDPEKSIDLPYVTDKLYHIKLHRIHPY